MCNDHPRSNIHHDSFSSLPIPIAESADGIRHHLGVPKNRVIMRVRPPVGPNTQSEQESLSVNAATPMRSLCPPTQTADDLEHTSAKMTVTTSTTVTYLEKPSVLNADKIPLQVDEPSLEYEQQATTMTRDNLEAYLTLEFLQRFRIDLLTLDYYWDPDTLEPPITNDSLSELDLVRIINDPQLRHDINFEREISFKPNDRGEHVREKLNRAQRYWEALIVELSLYSQRARSRKSKTSVHGTSETPIACLTELSTLRRVALRLPRTIVAIREIIKTLVPGSEWATVDERLDVELLIQELENGVCNIKGLADWFQSLLLRSCSPLRDPFVHQMVALIHEGVDKDDARLLADGLRELFGILETMKLDVANHQIRYLRLLMIDDTVHFEQKTFLQSIANGLECSDARRWLDSGHRLELDVANSQSSLPNVVRGILELISDDRPRPWPPSLMYDHNRLMALKIELHKVLYRRACFRSFDAILRSLGRRASLLPEVYERLWARIEAVLEIEFVGQSLTIGNRNSRLEITREACRICNIGGLPHDSLLRFAEWHIYSCVDSQSHHSRLLRNDIGQRLSGMVEAEVQHLKDMTPLEMLNYGSQRPQDQSIDQESKWLSSIARRLAHISVLHWRIWAPILYDQPQELTSMTTDVVGSMNNLSLAEPTLQGPLANPGEKETWSAETVCCDALVSQSSTSSSFSDLSQVAATEQDSKEDAGPPDDPSARAF